MTFEIRISGYANDDRDMNQEIGSVKAVARRAINDLQALGLVVTNGDVNGQAVPPAASTAPDYDPQTGARKPL